ncbi:tRNA threonylcarbamoyladenosine dehydratase [Elizabethkingia argentiflava]|uniref:tRNA threonylcarbamoyladenosine dehydratase n=1 Tax=Elizabethkingia argenteiflava TaxID=2681556 RepID=A0A845PVD2_9FLAO|nr:tRNA threonylcarbamoyladenosine dehydratase [Elizabethkingia argenteiflava]NAW52189.1 tRNA threonylcarbamoyladenosine dehydratase [Elizabethkingia argenteiflava]
MVEMWLERTELLIKKAGLKKLQNSNVLIVGMGGVGSFAAEFIARAGVGNLSIVDGDSVDITNINRQLPALHSSIDQNKVELMGTRIQDINPQLNLRQIREFVTPEKMENIIQTGNYDYIVDCIDSVSPKLALIKAAKKNKVKIISCMGAGGKLDPSKVIIRDISKTRNCYLAKQIRKRLKKEGIQKGIRCVFSTELQREGSLKMTDGSNFKKSFYGTISYMPAIFGLYAASEVIRYLIKD